MKMTEGVMNPWSVLPALAALTLVFVVTPTGVAADTHARRPFRLVCPHARAEAHIRVAATRAAVAAVFGCHRLAVERCSLRPAREGCREGCPALPPGEDRVFLVVASAG